MTPVIPLPTPVPLERNAYYKYFYPTLQESFGILPTPTCSYYFMESRHLSLKLPNYELPPSIHVLELFVPYSIMPKILVRLFF
jgi:hypothetical protein